MMEFFGFDGFPSKLKYQYLKEWLDQNIFTFPCIKMFYTDALYSLCEQGPLVVYMLQIDRTRVNLKQKSKPFIPRLLI